MDSAHIRILLNQLKDLKMPSFVVIESKKDSEFNVEAQTVLEAHKFKEVHAGTYTSTTGASTVASKLKNLESYKKNKSAAGIKVYHGNLTA